MVVNMLITNFMIISNIMAFFMKPHAPKLLSKMILLRENRHVLETARALLIGAHVPSRYWADAVTTFVHLLNRMPSKVLGFQTPLQTLEADTPCPRS